MRISQDLIVPESSVYAGTCHFFNVLNLSDFNHCQINYSKRFVKKHKYINDIENFWNQAKRQVRGFNGLLGHIFLYFLVMRMVVHHFSPALAFLLIKTVG